MIKRIAAVAVGAGLAVGLMGGVASATPPEVNEGNCVGYVVSFHTTNLGPLSDGVVGKQLVPAAKAFCRDGIVFHGG